jgi:capsular exopolysaccharide synthesis family protein
MSRFFDALKQANSSPFGGRQVPVEREEDPFGINDVHASSVMNGLETGGLAAVPAPVITAPTISPLDPWEISPEQGPHPRRTTTHNIRFTALARVAADQNVRMIPNAVDRAVVEHYRRLRTKIMQQHAVKPFRSLLVTSANPQEGKSVTVLNLGLSFAMLPSFRVLVVDGDMRRQTLSTWLGATDRPGLSNLIDGSASFNDVVFTCEESSIFFVPGGTAKTPPAELLHSSHLSGHFRKMTEQFDLVLMDSPPVNLITDAQLLAEHADAVLLVARAFKTTRKALEKAAQDLLPFRVIGTVMNGGSPAHLYRGYGGYY